MARILLIVMMGAFFSSAFAEDPLAGLVIEREAEVECDRVKDYSRWEDADGDGEHTRQEVLAAESLVPVTRGEDGRVAEGLWVGPYAGFVTRDPRQLDIDHVVAVCEAHESGAHAWDQDQRTAFANHLAVPHHLVATWFSTNRSKWKRDPAEWLPPNRAYWCTYLNDWIAIKREWKLSVDPDEAASIRKGLRVCGRYAKGDHLDGRHDPE